MSSDIYAMRVSQLSKSYRLKQSKERRSLKETVLGKVFHPFRGEEFWALKEVSFDVKHGETLGIIGPNGSGKTTLLSVLSGTTYYDSGYVEINGRFSSILELGAGFHPDLTGRENIYLYGSILGMSSKEITEKFDAIVDFAGLGKFIDSPVKYYSSGMYVRLGFSVAVEVDPDILIVDEVLAVGDEQFRKKCLERIDQFRQDGKSILFVSHDLEMIEKISDRVMFLNKGTIHTVGLPKFVVRDYKNEGARLSIRAKSAKEWGTKEMIIKDAVITDKNGKGQFSYPSGSDIYVMITYKSTKDIHDPVFGISIKDLKGTVCFGTNTQMDDFKTGLIPRGEGKIRVKLAGVNLQAGDYTLSIAVHSDDHQKHYHRRDNCYMLSITTEVRRDGLLDIHSSWETF